MGNRSQRKAAEIKFNESLNEAPAASTTPAAAPAKPKTPSLDEVMPGAARAQRDAQVPAHVRAAIDQEKLRQNSPANIAALKRKNELIRGASESREQGEGGAKVSRYSDADRRAAEDRMRLREEADRQQSLERYNNTPVSPAETKKAMRRGAVKPGKKRK